MGCVGSKKKGDGDGTTFVDHIGAAGSPEQPAGRAKDKEQRLLPTVFGGRKVPPTMEEAALAGDEVRGARLSVRYQAKELLSGRASRRSSTPFDRARIGTHTRHGIMPGPRGFSSAKINQDRGVVCWPFNGSYNQALLCVFDGHGSKGERASEFCMKTIPELLECRPPPPQRSPLPHRVSRTPPPLSLPLPSPLPCPRAVLPTEPLAPRPLPGQEPFAGAQVEPRRHALQGRLPDRPAAPRGRARPRGHDLRHHLHRRLPPRLGLLHRLLRRLEGGEGLKAGRRAGGAQPFVSSAGHCWRLLALGGARRPPSHVGARRGVDVGRRARLTGTTTSPTCPRSASGSRPAAARSLMARPGGRRASGRRGALGSRCRARWATASARQWA